MQRYLFFIIFFLGVFPLTVLGQAAQVPTTGTSGDFDNDVIEGDGRTQAEIDAGAGAAGGEEEGLVPCGRGTDVADACTVCDFFVLADRVIDFLTGLLFFIAMVIITVAGVTYIVSAGNPGLISTAKSAIKAAFFGAIIVLVAWVVITWGISSVATEEGVLAGENALGLYRVTGTWDFACTVSVPN